MNLYNIKNEYLELLSFLEENEGELTPELEELMKFNENAFKEKALNYIKVINNLKADAKYAKEEIDRIQSYLNKKHNSINLLETSLLDALKLYGEKDPIKDIYRFEAETYKMYTRKTEVVELEEGLIEDKWKEYTIEKLTVEDKESIVELLNKEDLKMKVNIPKTAIKKALEDGEEIEGAKIVEKYSLNIK